MGKRMHTRPSQIGTFVLCFLLLCSCIDTNKKDKSDSKPCISKKATLILNTMRDGSWQGRALPKLHWDDMDALLERADSRVELKSFPVNPLSSQAQFSCLEGIMAMWLIEAVRIKPKSGYPSLNPLCFSAKKKEGTSWEDISNGNMDAAAGAYRAWWEKVKDESEEKRKEIDPLKDALLYWY